jgi:hypothetical protein
MSNKDELFQKNCDLWSKFNPKQAVLLPYLESPDYAFCTTHKGELNLKTSLFGKTAYFHSQQGAVEEAGKWFSQLDLHKVEAIFVYGIGLGYYYDAAKAWLAEGVSRHLVFLEDDLTVMSCFLKTSKATEILQNPHIQVIYFQDIKDTDAAIETLYWSFAMARLLVTALGCYAEQKKEKFNELHHKIAYDSAVKNALLDEYLRFGGPFFVNFYRNMLNLPGSYLGNQTFNSFKQVPAIICGAGPSLVKSLDLLPQLKNKALIFAGGSALNAFNAAGIQPHLGAGIDPNPAQFDRLNSNYAFEVPFYYRNRMHHEAFEMIHGPRLYIPGCGGYDVANWFEENLHIPHEFLDEGHNVINFCLQIAHQLGCNPILFAGMDLAFTDGKLYAPGIEDNASFNANEALTSEDFDSRPIMRKDINGNSVHTLWKWVAESDWISNFAKEHPELIVINCTEGGIGFAGVPNRPLQEVAEDYLLRQYAIDDRLNGEIQRSVMPRVTSPKMIKLMNRLQESLQRSVQHLTILLEEAQGFYNRAETPNEKLTVTQSGKAALSEIELSEEIGYQYLLEIFNEVQSRILMRELQESKLGSDAEHMKKKLELNMRRFKFLIDVATINVELITMALQKLKPKKRKKQLLGLMAADVPPVNEENIQEFSAILLPEDPHEGQMLPTGHMVRILRQYGQPAEEIRMEKKGVLDGQCLLYGLDGKLRAEVFYRDGQLHGPSVYYSKKKNILSKSFYSNGLQEGESRWYYLSGALYAVQQYRKGQWDGQQLYFYPNGNPKTILHYKKGKIVGKAVLYYPDGQIKREVQFKENYDSTRFK